MRAQYPDAYFLCYGYCFGGYVALKCCGEPSMGFSAALSYHPSPQVCYFQPSPNFQTESQLGTKVHRSCPVLLLPAGNDSANVKVSEWLRSTQFLTCAMRARVYRHNLICSLASLLARCAL
jgi:dienelactone hydrolase